jgi:CNT family concentrative nucleoside transporter
MRKNRIPFFATGFLLIALLLLFPDFAPARGEEPVQAQQLELVLVHVNDIHGHIKPVQAKWMDRQNPPLVGGYATLVNFVKRTRAECDHGGKGFLFLDAGDIFQGTPEGNLSRGRVMIELMNYAGVDAMTVGNHEFDLGIENLKELKAFARFPFLGANIIEEKTGRLPPYVAPYVIRDIRGLKVAIIGLITSEMKIISIPELTKGLRFPAEEAICRRTIREVREKGARTVIVMSHCGEEMDKRLASSLEGVAAIVGGHSHTAIQPAYVDPKTGILVAQAGCHGVYAGRIDLTVDRRTGKVLSRKGRLHPLLVSEYGEDKGALAIIRKYAEKVRAVMDVSIGRSLVHLFQTHKSFLSSPLGNWITDVMRERTGTQLAFHNKGGMRGDLPRGVITMRHLFTISPFGNTLVTMKLKGSDIRELLRGALRREAFALEVSGLVCRYDPGAEPDGRFLDATVGGEPIDPERLYTVVTNSFLARGGDDNKVFLRGVDVVDTGIDLRNAKADFLKAHSPLLSRFEGRFVPEKRFLGVPIPRGIQYNVTSFFGIFVLLGIAWVFSSKRWQVSWKLVFWGLTLQLIFALLILKTQPGYLVFEYAKGAVNKLLSFTDEGARFVFGIISDRAALDQAVGSELSRQGKGFIFAFQVLPTIIFFSSLMAVLYHLGIMQWIVLGMAKVMQKFMGVSGAESLSVAANVFVGQTEAPLVVRPYVPSMTRSELMALMSGGFATIAGGVLVAYVKFGVSAGHLLAASIMSAPAALVMAKIMIPETEKPETAGSVKLKVEKVSTNVIDAAAGGAADGVKLAINVAAMLLAFIALIAMINWFLGLLHGAFASFIDWTFAGSTEYWAEIAVSLKGAFPRSLKEIFGWIFWPVAFVMGVPVADCNTFAGLVGEKISINEFVAYLSLKDAFPETLRVALLPAAERASVMSPRAIIIGTYALCGFANFGSIAIQLGGIGGIAPNKRHELARLGLRALLAGALASFMTATLAGMVISWQESDYRYARGLAERRLEEKKYAAAVEPYLEFQILYPGSSRAAGAQEEIDGIHNLDMLREAKSLKKAGNEAEARRFLERLLDRCEEGPLRREAALEIKGLGPPVRPVPPKEPGPGKQPGPAKERRPGEKSLRKGRYIWEDRS